MEYAKQLKLFEECFFDENGRIIEEGWKKSKRAPLGETTQKYTEKAISGTYLDGLSEIYGRSTYTPIMIREKDENNEGQYKYYITLDQYGRFEHHYDGVAFMDRKTVTLVDITDMPKDDILAIVNKTLNMSNKQIMEMFDIGYISHGSDERTPRAKVVKTALLVEDLIKKDFEEKGIEIEGSYHNGEKGIGIKGKEQVVGNSMGHNVDGRYLDMYVEGLEGISYNRMYVFDTRLRDDDMDYGGASTIFDGMEIRVDSTRNNFNNEMSNKILQFLNSPIKPETDINHWNNYPLRSSGKNRIVDGKSFLAECEKLNVGHDKNKSKSLEELSLEEIIALYNENSLTIAGNEANIRNLLIQKIKEQQNTIREQEMTIEGLRKQQIGTKEVEEK